MTPPLTPEQCAAKVHDEKRKRLATVVGRVEAGRQEVANMQLLVSTIQKRLDVMLVDLTYDLQLLDEVIKVMDEEPTVRLPRLPSSR